MIEGQGERERESREGQRERRGGERNRAHSKQGLSSPEVGFELTNCEPKSDAEPKCFVLYLYRNLM